RRGPRRRRTTPARSASPIRRPGRRPCHRYSPRGLPPRAPRPPPPIEGANLEQSALDFTGIDPYDIEREAVPEREALSEILSAVRKAVKAHGCKRAILVGHNATFDHSFLFAAAERADIKRNPFHPFSTFDTATLAGLAYGHTVLAQACKLAGIPFSNKEAHSAAYDAEKTADLFCGIVNRWKQLGGYPPPEPADPDSAA
ncbi:MAG: exonuclease domain-containing protein, partial [Marinobacter sp.]|uniref:exonuclease domain-containing protein n=1 Tax=Marinobacter sp. TaxID=50741 RepID=UPI00299DE165